MSRDGQCRGVDVFTKEQFEFALPSQDKVPWTCIGLVDGEYAYRLPVQNQCRRWPVDIIVRSSVQRNGLSAGNGEDSIRCWLVWAGTMNPAGGKLGRWVTRMPGWQGRLTALLRSLWVMATKVKPCARCNNNVVAMGVYRAKTEPHNGRVFLKCAKCGAFEWTDIWIGKGKQ